jgi:hypothetical protein
MNAQTLSAIAGALLSLALAYIPGLRDWFGKQTGDVKRLVTAVLLLLVAAGSYGLACAGWTTRIACDEAGLQSIVESFLAALVANQGTYSIAVSGRNARETGAARVKEE